MPTHPLNPFPRSIRVYCPGSVGNLGPGLDILGLATTGAGDTVEIELGNGHDITLVDPGHPDLPTDAGKHAAGLAIRAVCAKVGAEVPGCRVSVTKGLPLAGGQGGSAASAAAAAIAMNEALGCPLNPLQVISVAVDVEAILAGRHADNVAPSVLGGLVLIVSTDPLDVVSLPTPENLRIVLIHPEYAMLTSAGRALLPATVSRDVAVAHSASVAGMVAGACLGDLDLLGRSLVDRIGEPARASHLPGFPQAKAAAEGAGALGCSISGSGPTAFALVSDESTARRVESAMMASYRALGIPASGRVAEVDRLGARVG